MTYADNARHYGFYIDGDIAKLPGGGRRGAAVLCELIPDQLSEDPNPHVAGSPQPPQGSYPSRGYQPPQASRGYPGYPSPGYPAEDDGGYPSYPGF